MSNEFIDLDEYLASRSFDVLEEKVRIYEAVAAALLRKYVPLGKKIEIDLVKVYNNTILDLAFHESGKVKLEWREDHASI